MSNFAVVFNNSFPNAVTKNFKLFLDSNLYIDLVFVCHNNKKVGAHQIVMGCMSKFFYGIFLENLSTAREKVVHVYVPDIRARIMKRILEFAYCGKAKLSKSELDEFNEDIKLLGMKLDVCSSNEIETAEKNKFTSTTENAESTSSLISTVSSANSNTPPSACPDVRVNNQNDNIVSSSNVSPLAPPPDEARRPPSVDQNTSNVNKSPIPGLPVIQDIRSLSDNSSQNHSSSSCSPINPKNSSNSNSSSGQKRISIEGSTTTNSENSGVSNVKRTRLKENKNLIILDSDEDENDSDVITIS